VLAGDGLYTFQLSSSVGAGNQFPHHGLLGPGEFVHFRYMLGQTDAREYGLSVTAAQAGISAFARPAGAPAFTQVSVGVTDAGLPYFNVP
jgi:hypothetical protein